MLKQRKILRQFRRVTGKRIGHQSYKSRELAGRVGAGLIDKYQWKVDLKNFNLEARASRKFDQNAIFIYNIRY
jgi:hypothetical protein